MSQTAIVADTIIDGKLLILQKVGEGGNGEVFIGRQLDLDRAVAVKFSNVEGPQDEMAERRFAQEAAIIAKLRHPNIVPVYAFGQWNGRSYFVSEFIQGRSLQQIFSEQAKGGVDLFDERQLRSWLVQVCHGLQAAHAAGIVHRDLKPSNILIDENNVARLIDFGLAKRLDSPNQQQLTIAQMAMGTVGYMSPEQCLGRPVRPQTDFYSLGCILQQGLTGKLVFETSEPVSLMYRHVHELPPALTPADTKFCREFQPVLDQLLQKSDVARPASAAAVVEELESISFAEPRLSVEMKSPQWLKSNNRALHVSASMLGLLCGAVVLFCWVLATKQEKVVSVGQRELVRNFEEVTRVGKDAEASQFDSAYWAACSQFSNLSQAKVAFRKLLNDLGSRSDEESVRLKINVLLSLSDACHESIDYSGAATYCIQALQLSDVLYGKDSLRQIPLLEKLLQIKPPEAMAPSTRKGITERLNKLLKLAGSSSDSDVYALGARLDSVSDDDRRKKLLQRIIEVATSEPRILSCSELSEPLANAVRSPESRLQLAKQLPLARVIEAANKEHQSELRLGLLSGWHALCARLDFVQGQKILAQHMRSTVLNSKDSLAEKAVWFHHLFSWNIYPPATTQCIESIAASCFTQSSAEPSLAAVDTLSNLASLSVARSVDDSSISLLSTAMRALLPFCSQHSYELQCTEFLGRMVTPALESARYLAAKGDFKGSEAILDQAVACLRRLPASAANRFAEKLLLNRLLLSCVNSNCSEQTFRDLDLLSVETHGFVIDVVPSEKRVPLLQKMAQVIEQNRSRIKPCPAMVVWWSLFREGSSTGSLHDVSWKNGLEALNKASLESQDATFGRNQLTGLLHSLRAHGSRPTDVLSIVKLLRQMPFDDRTRYWCCYSSLEVFVSRENWVQARSEAELAVKIADSGLEPILRLCANTALAMSCWKLGDEPKAREYFQKSMELYQQIDPEVGKMYYFYNVLPTFNTEFAGHNQSQKDR